MVILNRLYISQSESNSLYSISHINETIPREMANGLLEVRQFGYSKFQNATAGNVDIKFLDIMTFYVPSGNNKSHLAPDCER
jgi:hypothetical protein